MSSDGWCAYTHSDVASRALGYVGRDESSSTYPRCAGCRGSLKTSEEEVRLLIEVQRHVYRMVAGVDHGLRPRGFQVVEHTAVLHACQEMIGIFHVEWTTRCEPPHLADFRLGHDIQTDDVHFAERIKRTWIDLELDSDGMIGVVHIAVYFRCCVQ